MLHPQNDFLCLPYDILQDIFWWVVISSIGQAPKSYCPGSRNQLLVLSHVSRFWRQAAIGRADLWAEVLDPRDPSSSLFNLIYLRTRHAPLKLRVKLKHRKESDESPLINNRQWDEMLSNVHRMSVIAFQFKWGDDVGPILRALEEQGAPLLKALDLKCSSVFNCPMKLVPKRPIQAERLRALHLEECIVSPGVLDLQSVETFSLQRRGPSSAEVSTWWDACFSGRMLSLRQLSIGYVRSFQASNDRTLGNTFSAPPNLLLLDLTAAIGPCVRLLERTPELPESCNVNIACIAFPEEFSGVDEVDNMARSLVSLLSRLWNSTSGATSHLELRISDFGCYLTHHSTLGRTIRLALQFEEGDATFLKQLLHYLSSNDYCPTPARKEAWLRLSVHIMNRHFAHELHAAFVGFLAKSRFGMQVSKLCLCRYTLGMPLEEDDESWEDMNLFKVNPEVEGVVLPSLKHLRYSDTVLKDPGLLRDFCHFKEARTRLQCPIEIVGTIKKRSSVLLRKLLSNGGVSTR
ncbi:hypothetical protein H1R20_g8369, partial [Candolleomyces eurysporus]